MIELKSGFFNSVNGDRKYNADDMSSYYEGIISRGVLQNYEGKFAVTSDSGMEINMKTGKAYFSNGKYAINDKVRAFTIDPSDVLFNRIDRVVLKCDKNNARKSILYVKKGALATNPVPPTLENSDSIEEMSLAQVRVNKLVNSISQKDITDERTNNDVCGFIHTLIRDINTSDLYEQYNDGYKNNLAENQKKFDELFANMGENVASKNLIRVYRSYYITVTDYETRIPININNYNNSLDILSVYINGFKLIPDIDYNTNGNIEVILTKPVKQKTPILIEIYKSVDRATDTNQIDKIERTDKNNCFEKQDVFAVNNTLKIKKMLGLPLIQKGLVKVKLMSPNVPTIVTVKLEQPFVKDPIINAILYLKDTEKDIAFVGIKDYDMNKSEFKIVVIGKNTIETVVHWIAIGEYKNTGTIDNYELYCSY